MTNTDKKKISLIAPFFNEEQNVEAFIEQINTDLLPGLPDHYELELVCINDGSKDQTLTKLKNLKQDNSYIRIIDFSRNFGKEAAISAGLDFSTGCAVIPIDSDLQHPPELILKMLEQWEQGYEVVLARRLGRETDSGVQKLSARAFYEISRYISSIEIPRDVGDFRLMDRKVVNALVQLKEKTRFMKGLFAWVGFRTTVLEYRVAPRQHGKSSFGFWKLWNFALDGVTSFSTVPLRIWTYLGATVSSISFAFALYLIIKTLVLGVEVPGYASLMVVFLFFSGVQLIGIGVLGEYVGRIFIEVKGRPLYVVREIVE